MTLQFTDGAYNRASGTRNAFGSLSAELVAEGFPPMVSRSGDREFADEVKMFTSRYRQQATGTGAFGDVRTWDGSAHGYPGGTRWVRVSSEGTVAVPGASNHGKRRSNDLRAPYNTDTAAARRAKVLAKKHNITREGENFAELWHWTHWGDLGSISAASGNNTTTPTTNVAGLLLKGAIVAEAIVSVNKRVIHLAAGVRNVFANERDYNTFRDQVNAIRGRGATDIMPLPALAMVPNIEQNTHDFLCDYIGAPRA